MHEHKEYIIIFLKLAVTSWIYKYLYLFVQCRIVDHVSPPETKFNIRRFNAFTCAITHTATVKNEPDKDCASKSPTEYPRHTGLTPFYAQLTAILVSRQDSLPEFFLDGIKKGANGHAPV